MDIDIFKIGIIGIIAAILAVTLKKEAVQFSLLISIAAGILIFLKIIPYLQEVINSILQIISKTDTGILYIGLILKIIGISYISEFCAQICQDAGENAIASKIELCGKILIMLISIPIITELLNLITNLIP